MRRPTRWSLLLAAGLVAALLVALVLRWKAPSEAARLLPECDAIVYLNLKPLRAATHFDQTTIARSPDFQHFIDATGIVPERDLDAAAFAVHRMEDPNGPNGPVAYSEVFEGHIDAGRLERYLASLASSQETYADHIIFTIPVGEGPPTQGRQLRVAQLGYDTIAASNMPTPEQIHAILDRYRSAALPFAGSSLLAARFGDVPVLSSAWAIGHVGLPFSESGFITLFGLRLPLTEDTTLVASLRYLGSMRLRVEAFAPSEAEAARSTQSLSAVITLLRSLQQSDSSTLHSDAALQEMLNSLRVEQKRDRTVFSANIPTELLRELAVPQAPPVSAPASH